MHDQNNNYQNHPNLNHHHQPLPPPPPKKRHFVIRLIDHRERWRNLSKKHKVLVILVALIVIGAAIWISHILLSKQSEATLLIKKHPVPKSNTVPSPLTGVEVDPALAKRPVTGIMIENSPDARPQSGIQDAGVIFEAIAEGGITRFMTLYQEAQPQYIGPVRSLRPYYLDMAAPFQAGIVHVGGSPDALSMVRNGSYRDLDQFFNAGYFTRISARAAPHNVYTSFEKLDSLNQAKGYTQSTFVPWARKKAVKVNPPTATAIDLKISSPIYYAHYDYDATSNTYMRSEGGAPHKATTSAGDSAGVQLHPNAVIALIMGYGIGSDGQHSVYDDTGSGTAYIFQNGGVEKINWSKPDQGSMITFTDSAGKPVKLDPGQTWVTLLGGEDKVSYTAPPPPAPTPKKP